MSPTIMLRCWMCGITIVEAKLETLEHRVIADIGSKSISFCSDCLPKLRPFIWLLEESSKMKEVTSLG